MNTTTRVCVIGGGVVGASVLYHLTKLGWSDVMLLERSDLTSGSTWHAAGGFHTLNGDTNMAALQGYTIRLYRELEELTGLSCGLHHVGGVTLADTQERFDMLKAERAKHRFMGLETEILGPEEIKQVAPITNIDGILGALYDPLDGHLDPSGTTHAYARAARMGGAEITTHCKVLETNPRVDGTWDVVTEKGTIHAEHVVNAAGLWAREVGAMAGVYLPLHPMEHQYIVTDEIAEIYERATEHPHVMDPAGESYLRQEGRGLCIGFYEQPCKPWAVNGTPWNFGHELLPDDFDKIEDSIAFAYRRFPILETAGVKSVIHGPFTFAPDGNPLVGPVPGLRNYWSACGVMAGFSQGGGVGLTLAQWMVDGTPDRDVFAMDVARFGRILTPGYTLPKVIENYRNRFSVAYPNEELPAARPFRTTPLYDAFDRMGAVWGQQYGLEVANYFAEEGEARYETPSFRRSNALAATAREVKAVREAVGINELQNFGKYLVTGRDARGWLDRVMAGRVPAPGRLSLTPMLNRNGRLIGDFTISCLSETEFQLTASYGAQDYHLRWFENWLRRAMFMYATSPIPANRLPDCGAECARAPARGAPAPMSAPGRFASWMSKRSRSGFPPHLSSASAIPAISAMKSMSMRWNTAHSGICSGRRGRPSGIRPFGMRAMMSLRLDKFFGSWLREYSPDYTPAETGLDRFISFGKPADFIGRAAAEAERTTGPARKLCAFEVDAADADVNAYEPIWLDGSVQGFCTSGGYSHHAGKSIALGFVPTARAEDGLEVEIEILGDMRPARLITTPLFDADGARMRG